MFILSSVFTIKEVHKARRLLKIGFDVVKVAQKICKRWVLCFDFVNVTSQATQITRNNPNYVQRQALPVSVLFYTRPYVDSVNQCPLCSRVHTTS